MAELTSSAVQALSEADRHQPGSAPKSRDVLRQRAEPDVSAVRIYPDLWAASLPSVIVMTRHWYVAVILLLTSRDPATSRYIFLPAGAMKRETNQDHLSC